MEGRGVTVPIFNIGLEGVGDECHIPANLPVGKSPKPTVEDWELGPVWKGTEKGKYLFHGSKKFPACSKLLYRLH